MKTKFGFLLLVLFVFIWLAGCGLPAAPARNLGAASLSMQIATPTPLVDDQSKIGSTNGILIMGIVIVAITSFPILFRKKKK